jgi:heme oxygenase (biliverdin-IX-beta and delta-forming)
MPGDGLATYFIEITEIDFPLKNMPVQPTTFLQQLRHSTAASHQALEENACSIALMSNAVTLEQYAIYLNRLLPFVKGFEEQVFPGLQRYITDLDERRKLHFLRSDLLLSGAAEQDDPSLNEAFFRHHYPDKASSFGGMYVLEGSTLGGKIITKHLQQSLGEKVAGKTSYLNPYGEQAGSRWKNFLQLLQTVANESNNEAAIITGALSTFSILDSLLSNSTLNKFTNAD